MDAGVPSCGSDGLRRCNLLGCPSCRGKAQAIDCWSTAFGMVLLHLVATSRPALISARGALLLPCQNPFARASLLKISRPRASCCESRAGKCDGGHGSHKPWHPQLPDSQSPQLPQAPSIVACHLAEVYAALPIKGSRGLVENSSRQQLWSLWVHHPGSLGRHSSYGLTGFAEHWCC